MSVPAFAALLERLVFTPGRNAKLALLRDWFATQPDPDRGVGLAALTEELVFTAAKPALIRDLVAARTDPVLLALSHDYVGDFAETVALIWPQREGVNAPPPALSEVVEALELTPKAELPALIGGWLDTLDASGRLLIRGEPGNAIIPQCAPAPGEMVLDKPGKGMFCNTDCEAMLKARDIRQLVFAGVTTEVCVQTSMREANDRGYECLLVTDATESYFPQFKASAIAMLTAQGGIVGWATPFFELKGAIE